ncbi:LAME_0H08768g1_1 [Lachancea meyersii CBS 8951]|uniref:LAME_0H08768g1_1 n=1 Tax=Lachancea meyersii CBS 8951 TaxID=1266667 RepID=A0A1G4KF97_9SACH|nr:LAME_0H08768g1_1 [Lachancea meyersii CBS 8951]
MSQGLLYGNFRIRTWVPQALVKQLKLDVKVVAPDDQPEEFARDFPLKLVPGMVLPSGEKLTEAIAVMYYLLDLASDKEAKAQLAGSNVQERAQILRWMSITNFDLLVSFVIIVKPLKGLAPYVKPQADAFSAKIEAVAALYEERLSTHTYLATENISLADLFATCVYGRCFENIFGTEWRAAHPATMRWYNTVKESAYLKEFFAELKTCDKPLPLPQTNKKKEAKKESKKDVPATVKAPAAKAQAAPEPPAEPKKPKHPLETLGKSTFSLDEWKRKYSNEDTRTGALPWFWENYNPEEYSIWKVDFKYNDELTLTFMSNNLVGGFFNRLSGSVKYMFGCLVVYGENNDNGITGAVMVRGQDFVPAFDVAPDWESYSYAKLDVSKPEDKDFIGNMWAWDKPVVVDDKEREIADGKVLK